jgi:acetate kinase
MNILVINSGSSSIKFQLIQMPEQDLICQGLVDRIGLSDSEIKYQTKKVKKKFTHSIANHKEGLNFLADLLLDPDLGVVENKAHIDCVGHRVVHGGSSFSKTTVINEEVKAKIAALFSLAPLHNPANLQGIEVAEAIFDTAVQVAVFDTAFHQSIPEIAYRYAIDKGIADREGIRVYGFHGTSHRYVSQKAIDFLGRDKSEKLISIHLGNGCSITAIKDGKSVDHSLGFGPVNGLVMGTRSGDIDQSVIFYLMDKLNYTLEEASEFCQKKAGMLGLTGMSDLRDIEQKAEEGDRDCQLALEINAYRIKKFIGAYIAVMDGVDAILFTAGIGENSSLIRSLVCSNMKHLGIHINSESNALRSSSVRSIAEIDSPVEILVCPTNEELEIARQAFDLLT